MRYSTGLLIFIAAIQAGHYALADTIYLKNGKKVEVSSMIESGGKLYVDAVDKDGHTTSLTISAVDVDHVVKSAVTKLDAAGGTAASQPANIDYMGKQVPTKDARAFLQEAGDLMSFPHYRQNAKEQLPAPERFYMPVRSNEFVGIQNGYQQAQNAVIQRFQKLATAQNPVLKAIGLDARVVFRERLKIAMANQVYGNTPDSSITEFGQYLQNADKKLDALNAQLSKDQALGIDDDPLPSPETMQKLINFGRALDSGNLVPADDVEFSSNMLYADMAAVDAQANFWKQSLVPMAKALAGPAAAKPLVEVSGNWRAMRPPDAFSRLDTFAVKNVSGKQLSHTVVEIQATNQWNEQSTCFCYVSALSAGETLRMVPALRWDKRRLDFTNALNLTISVWSDEASDIDRAATLNNPKPCPDPAGWRQDYLRFDNKYARNSEGWAIYIEATFTLK